MSGAPSERQKIEGWEAIAAYLHISRKTAQNYRKYQNLPIHQMPGEKSPVWAYAYELDRWQEAFPARAPDGAASEALVTSGERGWRWWIWGAGLLILLGVAGLAAYLLSRESIRGPLAGVRRERPQEIVAVDANGRELWRHRFPARFSGQYSNIDNSTEGNVALVADIDADSAAEVLFTYFPQDYYETGTTLYCFSDRGKVKWTFRPGRELSDRIQRFSPAYAVWQIAALPRMIGKYPLLVLSSHHAVHYPHQVAALGGDGSLLGEYWHSGHLLHMRLLDIDGDGRQELLFGGVNNGYQRATLVALNPLRLEGCSQQRPDDPFQLQGCGKGSEKAIVRFRRTHFSEKLHPYNRVIGLLISENGMEVQTSETYDLAVTEYMTYQFDHRLNLLGLRPSDSLISSYRALVAARQLDRMFDDREAKKLRQIEVIRDLSIQ